MDNALWYEKFNLRHMHFKYMQTALAQFIKYLEDNDLVRFEIIGDGEECFENRLRIQKYVFLAKHYGMSLPFRHNMYLYGPYSRSLTRAYYRIAEKRANLYDPVAPTLPKEFRSGDFLNDVGDKSTDWLEVATTLMDRKSTFPKKKPLIENVHDTKIGFTRKFISSVLEDLLRLGLVRIAA